jgi:Uma2 family endonuclease
MTNLTQVKRITVKEFHEMYPDETTQPIELIDGEIVIMPSPRPEHQEIIINLSAILWGHIKANQLGRLQVAPSDVHFDELNIVQPDVFFVAKEGSLCKIGEEGWWVGAPDLCIEIISPSSIKNDRADKFDLYEKHGVREYWIVDPQAQLIEVYVRDGETLKRQGAYVPGGSFTSTVLPQLTVQAAEVFV